MPRKTNAKIIATLCSAVLGANLTALMPAPARAVPLRPASMCEAIVIEEIQGSFGAAVGVAGLYDNDAGTDWAFATK